MQPDPLRLVIADDEPLARALVRRLAEAQPDVVVVAECDSGDALAAELRRARADVVLLDIRMPGTDIFAVLAEEAASGRGLPAVIFSTAFDAYAARAFELNAVDYLVKPYTEERLAEGLRRARTRRRGEPPAGLARTIRDLGPRPDRILVPDGRRMAPIAVADIIWIKAEDDYARVHVSGRSYLVSRTLKELEARLDPERFLRLHRSAIVQTTHIRHVAGGGSGRYRLTLSDDTVVVVSRSRLPALKKRLL